ncbi:MAG: NFACT family protein, partial [Nitrospiraceae bacterium]
MSLSVGEIAWVVGEIAPVLTGAWIQKIYQPTARAIVLATRAPGQTLLLYLSTAPGATRLHVLSRKLPNPGVPLPFCQFLRAHIQGARVEAVEQVPGDRIVRFRLTAQEGPCSLIAELTGRRPTILLLNQDERVLATLIDSHREKRGQPYALPSRRSRPRDEARAEAILAPAVGHPFPISFAIERRYQARERELTLAQLRQARLASVRKELKRAGRLVERLQADLEKAERYRDFARYGELLKANLHSIAKGQDQITVVDYYDPALTELAIPLDPG